MKQDFLTLLKLKADLDKLVHTGKIFDVNLQKLFFLKFIYTSSIIEGVKLKKSEIATIVSRKRKMIPGKIIRADLAQAWGQKRALDLVEKWAKDKEPIRTQLLLEIHKIVFGSLDPNAGSYRQNFVKLRDSGLMPSFPFIIEAEMRDFNDWLIQEQKQPKSEDLGKIVYLVAKSYHQITRIHPFSDGNGRCARLFVNLILRRYGLPHIIIPKVDKAKEMRVALRRADMGNLDILVEFIGRLLKASLKTVLAYWRKNP